MSREWKPGTVALIEAGCHANRRVAIRTGVPSNMGWAYSDTHNGLSTQNWTADSHGTISVIRPLVVIDPEDREQVKRLLDLIDHAEEARLNDRSIDADEWQLDAMQQALRSLLTPPRPEEPQGLGAVVEDVDGLRWVRVEPYLSGAQSIHAWRSRVPNALAQTYPWRDLKAVRVLSEGVTS